MTIYGANTHGGSGYVMSALVGTLPQYSLVFAKNTSVSRIFSEDSGKIAAGRGILGEKTCE